MDPLQPTRRATTVGLCRIGYMKAVVADPLGGPESLKYIDQPTPEPGAGEVVVKLEAIGVNFIDTYFRNGTYKAPETPVKFGGEGVAPIAALGRGVNFKLGQRVASTNTRGSCAESATNPQKFLADLPQIFTFEIELAA